MMRYVAGGSSPACPAVSAVVPVNRRIQASCPSGSGTARSRPSSSAAESRSTPSSMFRSAASRTSRRPSPCSMPACCCCRQAPTASRVRLSRRSRPSRSMSAGEAPRSSPSSRASSWLAMRRRSRGASASAASLSASSSRADSPLTTVTAPRLLVVAPASRARNCSTRPGTSVASERAVRRATATSSSKAAAIRPACAIADRVRSADPLAARKAVKSAAKILVAYS